MIFYFDLCKIDHGTRDCAVCQVQFLFNYSVSEIALKSSSERKSMKTM